MGDLIHVDGPDDVRLRQFRRNDRGLASRADRRDDSGAGLFLAEGDLVVERALDAGCAPVAALADAGHPPTVVDRLLTGDGTGERAIDVYVGGDAVRQMVTGLGMPHPVVALFERPPRPPASALVAASRRLVVVEGVDNPANVGAIVRNAAALGWDALLLDRTSADPLARRALRVSMGTAFELPHARTGDLATTLRSVADLAVIALTPDPAAVDIGELRLGGRRAVVIGSERHGISEELSLAATHRCRIPMRSGVDSLNAAAASAIACFALRD